MGTAMLSEVISNSVFAVAVLLPIHLIVTTVALDVKQIYYNHSLLVSGISTQGTTGCNSLSCCKEICDTRGSGCAAFQVFRPGTVDKEGNCFTFSESQACKAGEQAVDSTLYIVNTTCKNVVCGGDIDKCKYGVCSKRDYGSRSRCLCNTGFTGRSCNETVQCIPDIVNNAIITPARQTYHYKDIVTYTCAAGYELEGLNGAAIINKSCRANGTFGHIPPCVEAMCRASELIASHLITEKIEPYKRGEDVIVRCQEGFLFDTAVKETEILTCLANGTFAKPFPVCFPDKSQVSAGIIAGICLGGFACVIALCIGIIIFVRRRKRNTVLEEKRLERDSSGAITEARDEKDGDNQGARLSDLYAKPIKFQANTYTSTAEEAPQNTMLLTYSPSESHSKEPECSNDVLLVTNSLYDTGTEDSVNMVENDLYG